MFAGDDDMKLASINLKISMLCVYLMSAVFVGCGGGKAKISVLPSVDEFQQHTNADVKIDILFVIDDSGSMKPVQDNLRDNFESFIGDFYDKGFDFRVAVAKTSAYGTETDAQGPGGIYFEAGRTVKYFRCGHGNNCGGGTQNYGQACTGTYSTTPTTNGNGTPGAATEHILSSLNNTRSEMITKFNRNADVGLCGSGDERALQSAESVLRAHNSSTWVTTDPDLAFPRAGSHLAVIHVGDEPDGKWSSASSSNTNGSLNDHNLSGIYKASASGNQAENELAVQSFLAALEVHEPTAEVSVHAIQNLTNECDPASQIGWPQLYMASIADGLEISICNDFATPLGQLADHISSLASSFELSKQLDANGDETLKVYVQGLNGNNPLPRNTTNGFEYDINTNKVTFYGSMIPPQGALIGVTYTCSTLECE